MNDRELIDGVKRLFLSELYEGDLSMPEDVTSLLSVQFGNASRVIDQVTVELANEGLLSNQGGSFRVRTLSASDVLDIFKTLKETLVAPFGELRCLRTHPALTAAAIALHHSTTAGTRETFFKSLEWFFSEVLLVCGSSTEAAMFIEQQLRVLLLLDSSHFRWDAMRELFEITDRFVETALCFDKRQLSKPEQAAVKERIELMLQALVEAWQVASYLQELEPELVRDKPLLPKRHGARPALQNY